MYMYLPAPTPDQTLESAEAPLSSLGRGQRQGRLAHNHAAVQTISLYTVYKQYVYIGHENSIFPSGCEMYNSSMWVSTSKERWTLGITASPHRPGSLPGVRRLHFPPGNQDE